MIGLTYQHLHDILGFVISNSIFNHETGLFHAASYALWAQTMHSIGTPVIKLDIAKKYFHKIFCFVLRIQ
jgi:hypothetical protein